MDCFCRPGMLSSTARGGGQTAIAINKWLDRERGGPTPPSAATPRSGVKMGPRHTSYAGPH